jgi:hypothetical protein
MLAIMGGGGPGKDHELLIRMLGSDAEPRRWDRGAWLRLAAAVTTLLAVAILVLVLSR